MHITFVNPLAIERHRAQQKCFAPVSLLTLAAVLRQEGHRVSVLDANAHAWSDEEVGLRVSRLSPHIVGIPVMSELLPQTRDLIRTLRLAHPIGHILLGGAHANAWPRRLLEEIPEADFVLSGESERQLSVLCCALERGAALALVPGLSYRDGDQIRSTPPSPPPERLDDLPPPAKDLVSDAYREGLYHLVLVRERPIDSLITSRGCPYACGFCCNRKSAHRGHSPHHVLSEITRSYEQGVRVFDFADANFTYDRDRALEIFTLLQQERLRISFRFKSRTSAIDGALVTEARRAGAYLISVGMESGSQRMLDRMGKGTRIARNVEACETILRGGLRLNTGWILGYPGETPESVAETVALIRAVRPTTANVGILRPYPGTPVYEEARQDGTLVGDWTPDQRWAPYVTLPWLRTQAELEALRRRVLRQVYLRPRFLWSFAREILAGMNIGLARYAWQELRAVAWSRSPMLHHRRRP